jgi:hypothetical protein
VVYHSSVIDTKNEEEEKRLELAFMHMHSSRSIIVNMFTRGLDQTTILGKVSVAIVIPLPFIEFLESSFLTGKKLRFN